MSKKLTRSQEKRRAEKKARRDAQKAIYKARAEAGLTKGSKRRIRRARYGVKPVRTNRHDGPCFNVGCPRCFPQAARTLRQVRGPVSPKVAA